MANVKNFGLIGVGSDLQLGKAGTRLINNAGTFNFKAANGSTDAALTAAGITSSSGNITLTTGNLIATAGDLVATAGNLTLTATSGTMTIGTDTVLSRQGAGVLRANGTGAFMVPVGNTGQQPTGATGMVRVNNDATPVLEYYNGTAWTQVSGTGALQTEIDNIETALGPGIDPSGNFNPGAFTDGPSLTDPTSFTDAIQQIATYVDAHNTLDEILPGAPGDVIYNNAGTWAVAPPGATSGVQGYDADLAALAALSTTGFLVRTGAGTAATVSLTESAGRITISNPDGVSGSPTFDLATVTDAGTGTFLKITRDAYGRVSGTTAVVASDITGLVDSTYVNVTGDTMTGNLVMSGATVTGIPTPTNASDAANKAYVDATAAGLTWKTAVLAATTGDVDISTDLENGDVLDGVTLTTGDRVLVKNQTLSQDNGIYIVQASGAAIRSTDADSPSELDGAAVFVQQGTVNADTGWTQTATIVTVGTTPQTWVQFSGNATYVAGTGLLLSGNTFSVNLGAGITELPGDEVGIHLFSPSAGALILTNDGTTRGTASGDSLHLLLPAGSGLTQDATGLYIPANGITNAMILNDSITLDSNSGTGSVALGGTLNIVGTLNRTTTNASGSQVAVDISANYVGQASITTLGTVTTGTWNANVITVPYGGTGLSTVATGRILYGAGTAALDNSAAFTFDDVDTLTVGTGTFQGNATDLVITATATNADLVLMPNGTGSVIVGPSGAGLIQSDTGTALTVRGNTTLTLESGTGDTTMVLTSGTANKVTISGPSAEDYATSLADEDLVNKYYVDQAIQSGAASGSVKVVKATVSLASTGSTNVGAPLPAGSSILRVKVQVTAADTGTGTLQVGKSGGSEYMTTSENDTQTIGLYLAETYVVEASSVQVQATVAGTPAGSGSAVVIVEYQVA